MAQGIGVAGQTFRTGRTAHVAGPHPLPWPGDGLDRGTDFQVRSVLSVPIAHAGRVRGVLQLLNRSGQSAFTDEDAATLASVADVLGEDMKWATLDAELAPAVGR
jgi:GAF domain-containing protein